MSRVFSHGTQVDHDKYERGLVITSRHRGFEYLVRFERQERWVRGTDLRGVGQGVSPRRTPSEALRKPPKVAKLSKQKFKRTRQRQNKKKR